MSRSKLMIKKTVLSLSLLTLISINNATAADTDDDYSYQANMLINKKPSIELAQADLPLSMKYERMMEMKRKNKVATAAPAKAAPAKAVAKRKQQAQPQIAAPAMAPEPAVPPIAFSDNKPVITIRFNQPNVYYQTPLYNIVKKTLEIKPDANFEVRSMIPSTGDEKTDNDNKKAAIENGQKILSSLASIGLPQDRIRINYSGSNTVNSNEVQVFVR